MTKYKDKALPDCPYAALEEVSKFLRTIRTNHYYPDGVDKRAHTGSVISVDDVYGLQWLSHEASRVAALTSTQSSS
jgi:hypothetical protein